VQNALGVLRAGEIILVAPESTRSPQLQLGKEGVAYLASRSGAPIVPVAITGTQGFPALRYTRRWRKAGVRIRFGAPFCYKPLYDKADRDYLRKMTDEAMYVLSGMLPESQRGVYADLSQATQETIEWL
jgi:1-acyl-sn-glycerol-3-phosphate acyltransferase